MARNLSLLGQRRPCPPADHRIDEPLARVGMALPARLQHVAEQEQAGDAKAVLQVLVGEG